MLGGIGVGAHEGEHDVGVVGARGPDLLAVDHEVIADPLGCCPESGQIEPAPGSLIPSDAVISARRIGIAQPASARRCRRTAATPR